MIKEKNKRSKSRKKNSKELFLKLEKENSGWEDGSINKFLPHKQEELSLNSQHPDQNKTNFKNWV